MFRVPRITRLRIARGRQAAHVQFTSMTAPASRNFRTAVASPTPWVNWRTRGRRPLDIQLVFHGYRNAVHRPTPVAARDLRSAAAPACIALPP